MVERSLARKGGANTKTVRVGVSSCLPLADCPPMSFVFVFAFACVFVFVIAFVFVFPFAYAILFACVFALAFAYALLFACVLLVIMVGCLTDSPSRERVIMANNHNDGKAREQRVRCH